MADWMKLIRNIAPSLAMALPPPFNAIGAVAIREALALGVDSTDQAVESAILSASPEQIAQIKIKELEVQAQFNQLQIRQEEIAAENEKTAAMDRDSARRRQVDLKDQTPTILSIIILCGYFSVQWYILTQPIAVEMREIVMRSLGTLDMLVGMGCSYFLGSSASSHRKDILLSEKKS